MTSTNTNPTHQKSPRWSKSGATTVMDPFHVVRLVGDKVTQCRQRLQQETLGRRGRKNDPLYQARRLLLTRNKLLSETAAPKVDAILQDPQYEALTRIWSLYQAVIAAYESPNRTKGRNKLASIIDALGAINTKGFPELRSLARTLRNRRDDILAYFTHPNSSNGPTEAINGRLEHLRGIALGFRNLQNYIHRSLLHTGGFKHHLQPLL